MKSPNLRQRMILAILFGLFLHAPAFSQDAVREENAILQRENEQLRRQVQELQDELAEANERIARLERMIERLQGTPSASDEAAQQDEVTIDESKPNASPRAHFNAVVASHDKAMGDMEMSRPNSRQRTAYLRALDKWVAAANREFKLPIEWHVRFVDDMLINRDGSAKVTVVAVDPKTDAQLGDPFDVVLDDTIVRRILPVQERGDLDKMKLDALLVPTITLNLNRPERGAFDRPRFVGPYAEYVMDVLVRSLVPVEPPKEAPAKREAQGSAENKDPTPNPGRTDPDR